jgi:hypothetical protein
MKITISEGQYTILSEYFKRQEDPIAAHIRKTLKDVYYPSNWGKIENPDGNCNTDFGVIGVYEHIPGVDKWSVLNRFDTNLKVRRKMESMFREEKPDTELNPKNFMEWITLNAQKLFRSPITDELVELNRETIEKGNRNEDYAMSILKEFFGEDAKIFRFCSGDIRDTRKGMDLSVTVRGKTFFVQVKPFTKVRSLVDRDGDTFFEVNSRGFDPTKYSQKNIQVFLFVDYENQQYIGFENKQNKIKKSTNEITRYDEPYLLSNVNFEGQTKVKTYRSTPVEDDIFKVGDRRLQNLEFRKAEIEKMIELEKQKLGKSGQK